MCEDVVEVFGCWVFCVDVWDEVVVFFYVVGDFDGVECDCDVEVGEFDD